MTFSVTQSVSWQKANGDSNTKAVTATAAGSLLVVILSDRYTADDTGFFGGTQKITDNKSGGSNTWTAATGTVRQFSGNASNTQLYYCLNAGSITSFTAANTFDTDTGEIAGYFFEVSYYGTCALDGQNGAQGNVSGTIQYSTGTSTAAPSGTNDIAFGFSAAPTLAGSYSGRAFTGGAGTHFTPTTANLECSAGYYIQSGSTAQAMVATYSTTTTHCRMIALFKDSGTPPPPFAPTGANQHMAAVHRAAVR